MKNIIYFLIFIALAAWPSYMLYNQWQDSKAPEKTVIAMDNAVSQATGWQKRCAQNDANQCEIFQDFFVQSNAETIRMLSVTIGRQAGQNVMAISTPSGIDSQKGYGLQVDSGSIIGLPINSCNQAVCIAASRVADDFVQALKSGNMFVIHFIDGAGKPIRIQLTLNNFTKTYQSL